MIQSRTSRAYARALYGASLEQQCLEPVSADMIGIEKAVRSSIPMSRFLRDYSVGRQSRGRALDRFFQSRVSPLTSRFLEFLEQRDDEAAPGRRNEVIGVLDAGANALEAGQCAYRVVSEPDAELFGGDDGVYGHFNGE